MSTDQPGPILASGLAAVRAALAELPEGKQAAAVLHADVNGRVTVGVAARLGDDWAIAADFEARLREQRLGGSVTVVWSR